MRNIMLMVHFIGLIMGVGSGIANLFLSRVASKMERHEALKFMISASVLSRMGGIGLGLLILSGGYLLTPFLPGIAHMPTLIAKLSLVLVLMALVGMIDVNVRKLRKGDPAIAIKRLRILGPLTLLTGLSIVVLAVVTFH